MKGRTTQSPSNIVTHSENQRAVVPYNLIKHHKDITLCGDVMYIDKMPFLITVARKVKMLTAEWLPNMKTNMLLKSLKKCVPLYGRSGFKIRRMLLDGQFESLRAPLAEMGIQLNMCTANEHVPEAERAIRTIKERLRATINQFRIKHYPARVIIELVYNTIYWMNLAPSPDGISDTLGPSTIITGHVPDYNTHCSLEFGQYCQVYTSINNTMTARTVGALALRPTGNTQGGYIFIIWKLDARSLQTNGRHYPCQTM